MKIEYTPIGFIRSPFKGLKNTPAQPDKANEIESIIEIYPQFQTGLINIKDFSYITVLCHLHKSVNPKLEIISRRGIETRGIFATRSPKRPNPIGVSVVKLIGVNANKLIVSNLDFLNDSPVLDIKPYIGDFIPKNKNRLDFRIYN